MSQRPSLHLVDNTLAASSDELEFLRFVEDWLKEAKSTTTVEQAINNRSLCGLLRTKFNKLRDDEAEMVRLIELASQSYGEFKSQNLPSQVEVSDEDPAETTLELYSEGTPFEMSDKPSLVAEETLEPVVVSVPVVPEPALPMPALPMPALDEIVVPSAPNEDEINEAVGYFRDLPERMIRHESASDMLLVLWLWLCLKLSSFEDKQSDLARRTKQLKRWTGECLSEVFGLSWEKIETRRYFTEPEFALARSLVSGTHFEEFLAGVRFFDPPAEKKLIEWKNGECQFPLVPREVWYAEENQGKFYLIVLKWLLFRSLMNVRNEGLLQEEELRTCERRIKSRLTQVVDVLKAYFGYTDESLKGVAVSDREIWLEVRDTIVKSDAELTLWLENLDWSNDLPLPKENFNSAPITMSSSRVLPPPGGAFGGGGNSGRPASAAQKRAAKSAADKALRDLMKTTQGGGGQKNNGKGKSGKKNK